MLEGEEHCALQTLVDNGTITAGIQKKPKAIQMIPKEEEHFWDVRDELVADIS